MVKNHDPMTNRTRGLIPLPEGDVPETTQCITICIPDGEQYKRQLFAGLYEFTHWNAYERDATHKATLVAQAWRAAIMEGMLNCYQFRTNGGIPQFSNDGGATWTNVPGVNDGSTGYDPRTDEPLLPPRTGDNKPCLAAANATAVFVELHRQVVKWYDDNAVLLTCLGAIALALGVFFPVSWAVFGLALSSVVLATFFLTHTAVLNNAAFTSTIQEELTCILYCHADANGQWGEAQLGGILADIDEKSGEMWELIHYYVQDVAGLSGLNNAGTTTSVAAYDCAGCTDCVHCHVFDFTVSDWTWVPEYGSFRDSGGYRDNTTSYDALYLYWPEELADCHIVNVTLYFNADWTGNSPRITIDNQDHSTTYATLTGSQSSEVTITLDTDVDGLALVADRWVGNIQRFDALRLSHLRVRYIGTEQFGGDNC